MSSSGTIPLGGFFVIGGTLPRDAACYLRREADERLYSSLRRGEICYALTPRQMGKSSLMVQTAARLRERGASVALLDLTAFGQNLTPDQWYNGLIGRIGQQLDLEDELETYWNDQLHVGPFQRFSGAIREVVLKLRTGQVIIFIDEIDAVRSLPFSTDEFFAGIREFFNRRTLDPELKRLAFCLLGVATPSDLIRDTRTTPFNIGVRVELSDFTLKEAAPLAQGLCADPKEGQELIRRILHWTGGHPYLTQRLCQAIAKEGATSADVDRVCGELFLSHRARERDDNLLFVRERMLRNEADLTGLLLLYGKVRIGARVRDDETNPLVTVLRLAGIVRIESGYLRVRNRIYAEVFDKNWVTENLPGVEMRRQRAAYFRGFRIALIIFASLVLFAGAYEIQRLFAPDTTPPLLPRGLSPPAFWASFTTQSLQVSESGALLIRAGDDEISVVVNGAQYGRTAKGGSLEIPVLPAGDYEIRLEKPGFQSVSQHVSVLAQRETRLNSKLSPISQVTIENLLYISQAPASTKVSVDGKAVGTTNAQGDFSVKVEPGEHEIRLEKAGYLSRDFKEQLNPGNNAIDGKLLPDLEGSELDAAFRSDDPAKLQEFLKQYPSSKSAPQVRAKMEDLEWARYRDSNDTSQVQIFLDKYPNGQHIGEARRLADQLAAEDLAWRSATASNSLESLQGFIDRYPRSRHVEEARNLKGLLNDKAAISKLVREYEDSFNHHDQKRFLDLWKDCPVYIVALVNDKHYGTISLSPTESPVVKGDGAALRVTVTRHTETGDSSKTVPFQFKKENGLWSIKGGSL